MNATARKLEVDPERVDTDIDLDETIVYNSGFAASSPDQQRPLGSSETPMPTPEPLARQRYTFSSGARPLDGYTIKRAIGRGGFGEVYFATSDAGKEVALKLILRNLEVERRGVVQCMNLKCPNLLTVYDLKQNDAGESFVIMEYVAGPSLSTVLNRHPGGLPLEEVRTWLKGLVEGVAYLHDHGVVHRDLKPANLFMEEGIVKIGDYGLAKLMTPGQGTAALREYRHLSLHGPRDLLGQVPQADRRVRHGRDPVRDDHRKRAVRGRDRGRGPDEAPDRPARPVEASRTLSIDRRPGPGQGSEPTPGERL